MPACQAATPITTCLPGGGQLPAARRCPSLSLPPIRRSTKPLAAKEPQPGDPFTPDTGICPAAAARRRSTLPRNVTKTLRAGTPDPPIWAVRARRCPALAAARNRRFCGDIPSCPAAAHLQGGRIARSRRGGRGRTGYLGPCRPGPTPAEPPHGSANVKIAQGKGTRRETEGEPEPEQRPKGTNRRTPDEGKPEEGGRRGGTRRANGKPEESPQGETGGREVRPQTTR